MCVCVCVRICVRVHCASCFTTYVLSCRMFVVLVFGLGISRAKLTIFPIVQWVRIKQEGGWADVLSPKVFVQPIFVKFFKTTLIF